MKSIDKEEFYYIIYKNDLDICVNSSWDNIKQLMTTKFTYRNGNLFGYCYTNYDTDSDNYGENTYFIVPTSNDAQ